MSLKDHFRIGSNTKTMTSTVILQLVEEGKLKLNDPIGKFVPGVPNGEQDHDPRTVGDAQRAVQLHLRPGLQRDARQEPEEGLDLGRTAEDRLQAQAELRPGQEYEYCNTNIVLLGVVIEKLTGMSASEAFEERIFKPLGMTHTELPARTNWKLPEPHAQGYQFGTNVETIDSYAVPEAQQAAALDGSLKPLNETDANPSWAWTAGGAISTPADLATYVKAMVGGGLLDKQMQKVRLNSIRPVVPGQKSGVGYGLGIAQFAPNILGHDGQLPGFSSFMVYDIKTGDTVIISANLSASPVTGENAAVELGKVVLGTLYGNAIVPKGDAAPQPAASSPADVGAHRSPVRFPRSVLHLETELQRHLVVRDAPIVTKVTATSVTSNQSRFLSVLRARATAFSIASSMLSVEDPTISTHCVDVAAHVASSGQPDRQGPSRPGDTRGRPRLRVPGRPTGDLHAADHHLAEPRGQRRARRIAMSDAERDEFLGASRTCRVATVGTEGPHVAPLWFVWHDGTLWLTSLNRSQRWTPTWNAIRGSRSSSTPGVDYSELRGVELRGRVEVVGEVPRTGEPEPRLEPVERAFAEKYTGGSEFGYDGRHAWLALHPEKIVSWDFRSCPEAGAA